MPKKPTTEKEPERDMLSPPTEEFSVLLLSIGTREIALATRSAQPAEMLRSARPVKSHQGYLHEWQQKPEETRVKIQPLSLVRTIRELTIG